MKNKFILGAAAGVAGLALAVPILAQVSSAASDAPASSAAQSAPDPNLATHVGADGTKEVLLTGDDAAKATAAALAAVPGGTIERVETDTEGDAYEAHMTKADGTRVTVKFDASFSVAKIEEGHGQR